MEKSQRIEYMGMSLFVIGLLGILLFFYMAYLLFVNQGILGFAAGSDAATGFFTYLARITLPLVTLLVVGGVSLLIASKGIEVYSSAVEKNP
ncbi:MAG: hypothetical protein LUO82_05215 [Methanomicrobiales archaeon]|nr:hypothetical protein [Methanomicrobiales archaeon]